MAESKLLFVWIFALLLVVGCDADGPSPTEGSGPLSLDQQVRGWNMLSHHIVHDLNEVRNPEKRDLTNALTDSAHAAGVQEVVVWDHQLYSLDYYPDRFRTGPDSTLNFDNPDFWTWFKEDYRDMLDRVPEIDGLILTFIETGARAEQQHSTELTTPAEKLAAVVNSVGEVVIEERGLNLYARTFAYTDEEYDTITGAIERFEYPEIRLMMKATPHDFFLTHPNNPLPGKIDRPTLIELDPTSEFNGQGQIANTWPQQMLKRWQAHSAHEEVIGYVARTDRFGGTQIVGRPSEVNLTALKMGAEDPDVNPEAVYDAFITEEYGKEALPHVKSAFQRSYDIITSTLYTLGTNTANHSRLNYVPYPSSYARHVSGRWIDPPVVRVEHGVDREFHYWTDIVNHIAPAWAKSREGNGQLNEIPEVMENGWTQPEELMNPEYLDYVLTEKDYGIDQVKAAQKDIEAARSHLSENEYENLRQYFERTLLTARLHRNVAAAYWGFRVWCRGDSYQSSELESTIRTALAEIRDVSDAIRDYPEKPPSGQWTWSNDPDMAMQYVDWIENGWPKETNGFSNPQGGCKFGP